MKDVPKNVVCWAPNTGPNVVCTRQSLLISVPTIIRKYNLNKCFNEYSKLCVVDKEQVPNRIIFALTFKEKAF